MPKRTCLPWPSPPHPEQRNPVWRAGALLCLRELRHSPLRQASRDLKELRLGLRLLCFQRVSQPISKPLPEKSPDFLPRTLPQLRTAISRVGWLGFVSGGAVALVSAAPPPREETTIAEKQQRQSPGEGAD